MIIDVKDADRLMMNALNYAQSLPRDSQQEADAVLKSYQNVRSVYRLLTAILHNLYDNGLSYEFVGNKFLNEEIDAALKDNNIAD